jgi:hypothetical protein
MSKLPSSIRIGTQVWEIIEADASKDSALSEDAMGYTMERSNTIVIDKALPPSRKRQVVFHELLHALRFTYANPITPVKGEVGDWEHYFIGIYEEMLLVVFRDNPALLSYLTKDL